MQKFNTKYSNDKYKEDISTRKDNLDFDTNISNKTKYDFFRVFRKNIYLIVLFIVLLTVVLGYVFSNLNLNSKKTNAKQQEISEFKPEYYVNVNDMIVSLGEGNNKKSYLKISFSIHLSEDYDVKQVDAKLPIIKDALQGFLSGLRVSDFNYPGMTLKIKEELIKRINRIVSPIEVKDVLLQDIMVN